MVTRRAHWRFLWQWLLALLCVLPATQTNARVEPSITISVGSQEILVGDPVVLEIQALGLEDPIDLSVLAEVATIGRRTGGTRIAVFGGQVVEVRISRIEITPKQQGTVIVGPLIAGDVVSNSVAIKVSAPSDSHWEPGPGDLELNMMLSASQAWLGQELTLDIEFAHRYRTGELAVELPDLSAFDKVAVFERQRTDRPARDNTAEPLHLVRWRYLIYPKSSGNLSISSTSVAGEILKSRRERARFTLSTSPLTLNIKPSAFDPGQWWLAARDVRLTDQWSRDVREMQAGEEAERTIVLSATGVPANYLPTVDFPFSRAVRITPLDTKRQQALTEDGVVSTASFRYRVRAMSPIPVFLDTVRVSWFNTDEQEEKQAIIPARRINIGIPDRAALLAAVQDQRPWWNTPTEWVSAALGEQLANQIALLLAAIGTLILIAAFVISGLPARRLARHRLRQRRRAAKHHLAKGDYRALHALLLKETTAAPPLFNPAKLRTLVKLSEQCLLASGADTAKQLATQLDTVFNQPPITQVDSALVQTTMLPRL